MKESEGTEHDEHESATERLRKEGKGTTEGQRTQKEEDFGERGLHEKGGKNDMERAPSPTHTGRISE